MDGAVGYAKYQIEPRMMLTIQADALRKLLAARSALAIATLAGFGPDTVCESGDGGTPLTVAQLAELVKRCESEESRIRELLALVDARLAEVSPMASGAVH
ncbi:hypothetical protein SBA7_1620008 [Candidatus Sulfotelmatobacter sp. SbA7]|jgi:hypothetical protein|nr:hypothetical protein SBA7_1620008 [Candidatus Sulfotelmatobacter sp. SbA7]